MRLAKKMLRYNIDEKIEITNSQEYTAFALTYKYSVFRAWSSRLSTVHNEVVSRHEDNLLRSTYI